MMFHDTCRRFTDDPPVWTPGLNPEFKKRIAAKRLAEAERQKQQRLREAARKREEERQSGKNREAIVTKMKLDRAKRGRVNLQHVRRTTKFERIVYRMCVAYNVTPAEIKSETRNKYVVIARQAICYWARRLTGMSYPQIGRLVGNRDHTTILHAIETYQKKRAGMGRFLPRVR